MLWNACLPSDRSGSVRGRPALVFSLICQLIQWVSEPWYLPSRYWMAYIFKPDEFRTWPARWSWSIRLSYLYRHLFFGFLLFWKIVEDFHPFRQPVADVVFECFVTATYSNNVAFQEYFRLDAYIQWCHGVHKRRAAITPPLDQASDIVWWCNICPKFGKLLIVYRPYGNTGSSVFRKRVIIEDLLHDIEYKQPTSHVMNRAVCFALCTYTCFGRKYPGTVWFSLQHVHSGASEVVFKMKLINFWILWSYI